ncbi:MAG: four helix bundle protein [bacterium]
MFTDCLEYSLLARYAGRNNKNEYISKLVVAFDSLKFFLQILWDLKILDDKKYSLLSHQLTKIGKMIGGWNKYIKNETPPIK